MNAGVVISIVFGVVYIILTHFIAEYIGKNRAIGYGRSVFWCILLTPVIGIFIVLLSRKLEE